MVRAPAPRSAISRCSAMFFLAYTVLSLLNAAHAQITSLTVQGTLHRMVGYRLQSETTTRSNVIVEKTADTDRVELRCPEELDPETGIYTPVADCIVPATPLASGDDAKRLQIEKRLLSGDRVQATFDLKVSSSVNTAGGMFAYYGAASRSLEYRPDSLIITSRSEQKEVYTGTPIELKAVVVLLEFCGWENPFKTAQEARKVLFPGANATDVNVQSLYNTCSYNKTNLRSENVAVVGPVRVECTGTAGEFVPYRFDASRICGQREQRYWAEAASVAIREKAATDPALLAILRSQQRRHVYILPAKASCKWDGVGDVGCADSSCHSYIHGESATRTYLLFHELQHNMGLIHAGSLKEDKYDEYDDPTDPIGFGWATDDKLLCHNAPNNYRLGWARPINFRWGVGNNEYGNLTAANFTIADNKEILRIPAASISDENMVIVNLGLASKAPGAASIAYPKYFLSYRVRNATSMAFDSGLMDTLSRKIFIHEYNGTISDRDFENYTSLTTYGPRFESADPAFPAGDVWTGPFVPYNAATGLGGGLRVRVTRVGDTTADVEICRMFAQREGTPGSEECDQGVDRDCDGLLGTNDPDCQHTSSNQGTPSTSVPSLRPPPPRRSPPPSSPSRPSPRKSQPSPASQQRAPPPRRSHSA